MWLQDQGTGSSPPVQTCDCVLFCLRSTATWPLDPSKEEKQGWRHVRVKQMGKNASGQTHYLSLSGLELYGTVTAVCEDQLGTAAARLPGPPPLLELMFLPGPGR